MKHKITIQIETVLLIRASLALQHVAISHAANAIRSADTDKALARFWADRYNGARRSSIAFDRATNLPCYDFSDLDERMNAIMEEAENDL